MALGKEASEMQSYVSATFQSLDCAGGVCVVDGYGVQVRVRNRCLIVSDGIGRFRRERSFAKALVGIKRLVIISHEGAITLEALRWLTDAGIAFLQIDRDGEVIAGSANYGLNDPRLRRALALAPTNTTGLEIARYVLTAKLAGQEINLSRPIFPDNARAELTAAREMAENGASLSGNTRGRIKRRCRLLGGLARRCSALCQKRREINSRALAHFRPAQLANYGLAALCR